VVAVKALDARSPAAAEVLVPWLLALGALFILTVVAMPRGVVGELLAWMERRRVG
jgi:ABC-type branched-subunit amino acid transport system permease subunit